LPTNALGHIWQPWRDWPEIEDLNGKEKTMSEHYTKNTQQAEEWCRKCGRLRPHRIDAGRRGPCLVCLEKLSSQPAKEPEPERRKSRAELLKEKRRLYEEMLATSPLRTDNPEFEAGGNRTLERIHSLLNGITAELDADDFDVDGKPTDQAVFQLADWVYGELLNDAIPPEFGMFTDNPVPLILSLAEKNLRQRRKSAQQAALKDKRRYTAQPQRSATAGGIQR